MSYEDTVLQLDGLIARVPEEERHEVLTWTLWGTPAWSSFTNYAHVIFDVLQSRHGLALDADTPHRALAFIALGRAVLADRDYSRAVQELGAAIDEAVRSNKATLLRTCRALHARAQIGHGDLSEALSAIQSGDVAVVERDPPEFRTESALTLGLGLLLTGALDDASHWFDEASSLAWAHERSDLGKWQNALALAGGAHAAFRAFRCKDARALLREATGLARDYDAFVELGEFLLLDAVYALGSGRAPSRKLVREATEIAAAVPTQPAGNFLIGLPTDAGGCPHVEDLLAKLTLAAEERAEAADPFGWLIALLAHVAVLWSHDAKGAARDIMAHAGDLFGHAPEAPFSRLVGRATRAL